MKTSKMIFIAVFLFAVLWTAFLVFTVSISDTETRENGANRVRDNPKLPRIADNLAKERQKGDVVHGHNGGKLDHDGYVKSNTSNGLLPFPSADSIVNHCIFSSLSEDDGDGDGDGDEEEKEEEKLLCYDASDPVLAAEKQAVNPCSKDKFGKNSKCLPYYLVLGFGSQCSSSAANRIDELLRMNEKVISPKLKRKEMQQSRSFLRSNTNNNKYDKDLLSYINNFPVVTVGEGVITGDVDVNGGFSVEMASRLYDINPYLRIIFVVCDPVHRALSTYQEELAKAIEAGGGLKPSDEYFRNVNFGSYCFISKGCSQINENGIFNSNNSNVVKYSNDEINDDFFRDVPLKKGKRWSDTNVKGWKHSCSVSCPRLGNGVYADSIIDIWMAAGFNEEQIFITDAADFGISANVIVEQQQQQQQQQLNAIQDIEKFLGIPVRSYISNDDNGDDDKNDELLLLLDSVSANILTAPIGSVDWLTLNYLSNFYTPHNFRFQRFLHHSRVKSHVNVSNWRKYESIPTSSVSEVKRHCVSYTRDNDVVCYEISKYTKNPCFYFRGERKCFPYFTIVGWPKCGTSSLYYYLANHSQVEEAHVKETDFFSHWSVVGDPKKRAYNDYLAGLMPKIRDPTHITGEASTKTGPNRDAPMRQFQLLPFAKVIIVLRDPTEQLYSNFLMSKRGLGGPAINDPFTEEFDSFVRDSSDCLLSYKCGISQNFFSSSNENSRASDEDYNNYVNAVVNVENGGGDVENKWNPKCSMSCTRLGWGVYVDWIELWHDIYPKEQIHIIRTQDLEIQPLKVMRKLEKFLEIGEHDYKDVLKFAVNTKEKPDIYNVTSFEHMKEQKEKDQKKDPLLTETRQVLSQFYTPHLQRLDKFLDRKFEFSYWDNTAKVVVPMPHNQNKY